MAAHYVTSILRRKAERAGFVVEVATHRRVRGWPEPSAKPIHLKRIDSGAHVASFKDTYTCSQYLNRFNQLGEA